MTVLSLEGGGYLVYNPCNPTAVPWPLHGPRGFQGRPHAVSPVEECMEMLRGAGLTDVRYIVPWPCVTIVGRKAWQAASVISLPVKPAP